MPRPRLVASDNGPWPLHDAGASRAAEQAALADHVQPGSLMALAGLGVARLALATTPHARRVQVWAGPGNNGGDGLVAARLLHQAGLPVRVNLLGVPGRLPSDAARALQAAQEAGVHVQPGLAGPTDGDLHIDALLGLGTHRAPSGELAQAIATINRSATAVLAVDIPSGLHPDTGSVLGEAAVQARLTLALLTLKPGCFTHRGRDHAGDVWFDDLGVAAPSPTAWLAGAPTFASRRHASHKGSFGDVAVVGGAPGMVGAAWLAAGAALASGAGRVYCSTLASEAGHGMPARPELMTRQQWWLQPPAVMQACTVVCGCGGGDEVRGALPTLLAHAGRLVLDADALNAIAADPSLQALLERRRARGLPTLLTPHPLEAARLLGCEAGAVQGDRFAAARALASRFGAGVLLKGSGTVIAAPEGVPVINSTGNAALASAGTGDVLAGWAAGLWAQQPTAAPSAIATAAAWEHGHAADVFVQRRAGGVLRAAHLIEEMALLHGNAGSARSGHPSR